MVPRGQVLPSFNRSTIPSNSFKSKIYLTKNFKYIINQIIEKTGWDINEQKYHNKNHSSYNRNHINYMGNLSNLAWNAANLVSGKNGIKL